MPKLVAPSKRHVTAIRQTKIASRPFPGKKRIADLTTTTMANATKSSNRQVRRDRRDFSGCRGIVADVARFLSRYIVLSVLTMFIVAAWVVAAWLAEVWDRFPNLAVTSPEKRCGKTRFLQILESILPNPINTTNISPAAVYRLIESRQPTLLLDEAQSLSRRGSESSEVMRELLNAGIDRDAKVLRCGGDNFDVQEFAVYCPKVLALIGELDGVLADRCLPVRLERKTDADTVEPYRSRIVEPQGKSLSKKLKKWADTNKEQAGKIYDSLEPFPIENDRMAELLMPLQVVLTIDDPNGLEMLKDFAESLDEHEKQAERMSPGVRLLTACREIFARIKADKNPELFISTHSLILKLVQREEEPWQHLTRGRPITPEGLANLLRPYGIQSRRNAKQTSRGYVAQDFAEAWSRYLAPIPPKSPSISSKSSTAKRTKGPKNDIS